MPEATLLRRPALGELAGAPVPAPAPGTAVPVAGEATGRRLAVLRGRRSDAAFGNAIRETLGVAPPAPCATVERGGLRLVGVGPDEALVVAGGYDAAKGGDSAAEAALQRLRSALAATRHAWTDVSSGFATIVLHGPMARDVLSRGCPLDLHPRAFGPGSSAGSLWFKAPILLWQVDDAPRYEFTVRRSLARYAWEMLRDAARTTGLEVRRFD